MTANILPRPPRGRHRAPTPGRLATADRLIAIALDLPGGGAR